MAKLPKEFKYVRLCVLACLLVLARVCMYVCMYACVHVCACVWGQGLASVSDWRIGHFPSYSLRRGLPLAMAAGRWAPGICLSLPPACRDYGCLLQTLPFYVGAELLRHGKHFPKWVTSLASNLFWVYQANVLPLSYTPILFISFCFETGSRWVAQAIFKWYL